MKDLEERVRKSNIIRISFPYKNGRENGKEAVLKNMMAMNFPDLIKDTNPQFQEVQLTSNRINKNKISYSIST